MARNQYPSALQSHRIVKPMMFDELFSLNDISPDHVERETSLDGRTTDLQAVRRYYNTHYANSLDDFFDTTWYTQHGFAQLQQDSSLLDYIVHCESVMKNTAHRNQKALQSMEARLVWMCAVMPRSVSDGIGNAPSHLSAQEILPRVDTIEKLLSGEFLDADQVPPSPPLQASEKAAIPAGLGVATKQSIPAFWHYLAIFTSLRDDTPDSGVLKQIADNLQTLRFLLNSIESRDVIYSICILRHVGGRMIGYHPNRHLVATTNDPADNVSKLKAAAEFLEQQETTASNQVISRICGMARRSSTLQKHA